MDPDNNNPQNPSITPSPAPTDPLSSSAAPVLNQPAQIPPDPLSVSNPLTLTSPADQNTPPAAGPLPSEAPTFANAAPVEPALSMPDLNQSAAPANPFFASPASAPAVGSAMPGTSFPSPVQPTPAWPPATPVDPSPEPLNTSFPVMPPATQPVTTDTAVNTPSIPGGDNNSTLSGWSPSSLSENGSTPSVVPESPVIDNAVPTITESIPTDLSHLTAPSDGGMGGTPVVLSPTDNLVVAPAQPEAVPVAAPKSGFPKWLLAVGGVILLIVIGASAYFILGGKAGQTENVSVPAEQPPLAQPPQPLVPTAVPVPDVESAASATASGFGAFTETTSSAKESTSSGTGTSAIDLLKQRQGR